MIFFCLSFFIQTRLYFFASDRLKSAFQILNNIINVLGSDGETDGIRFDSLIQKLFLGQLGMSCGCRVNHQAFHIGYIRQQGENL